jgi:acyl carrier protein
MTQTPPVVPGELFDCLQVNLAVLADRWHGPGDHLRLGATLRFRPQPGAGRLPTVERTAEQHLADAQRALGLVVRALHLAPPPDLLRPAEGCYVVSDAYHLPWVPYFGQRHMEHSFLAEESGADGVTVVDGYHNETPWGSARPGRWTLAPRAFAAAAPSPALVAELAPAAEGPGPAAPALDLDLAGPEAVDAYVAAYARHPDRASALGRLALETWLLTRSRKLHAAFRARFAPLPDDVAVDAHLRGWDSLTEQVYLALRRVERGRAEPPGPLVRLSEQLHADQRIFGDHPAAEGAAPAGPPAASRPPAELRRTVAEVAAAVLDTDPEPLLRGRLLSEVPAFSSFRLVEIVERLEEELGCEFRADDLVPENLHDVDAVCAIVRRSPPAGAGPSFAHLGRP